MDSWLALLILSLVIMALLIVDLFLFSRNREPSFREGVIWSLGWLALSLIAALVIWPLKGGDDAVLYTTVYLIERSLSLDNLFVFILLFNYFAVPLKLRAPLLFWGIIGALVLRGIAIAGGVAILNQFHFVIYILAVTLLYLAYKIFKGVEEDIDPDRNFMVRLVRKLYPVTGEFHGKKWFVNKDGRRYATPLFLCLAAIMFIDLAFAVDSIPAAFAISRDPFVIWMGNAFALLGLRALFVLVEGLIKKFRYLDETIAIVLAMVALKLIFEKQLHISPLASFGIIVLLFTAGMLFSVYKDRKDPQNEEDKPLQETASP